MNTTTTTTSTTGTTNTNTNKQPPPPVNSTVSPDYAAGPASPNAAVTTTTTNATKIENPFDAFLTSSTTTTTTASPPATTASPPATANSSSTASNNNNWFTLMNEGATNAVGMDVFQLLPTTTNTTNRNQNSNTTNTNNSSGMDISCTGTTSMSMDSDNAPILDVTPITRNTSTGSNSGITVPPTIQRRRQLPTPPIDVDQHQHHPDNIVVAASAPPQQQFALGFDPETYSYDEEMNAIHSATSTTQPQPMRTLSETEEEETHMTNESTPVDHPPLNEHPQLPQAPVVTMKSLMSSSRSVISNPGSATMTTSNEPPLTTVVPNYHTYDYSDVAMVLPDEQLHRHPAIHTSTTFDSSGMSSIGDHDVVNNNSLELAPTTSSDMIRQQHQQQMAAAAKTTTRMISMGTGSVVVMPQDVDEEVERNVNDDINDDDDDQLAARIMFVLQGVAAMNSGSNSSGGGGGALEDNNNNHNNVTQSLSTNPTVYLPADQPHTSMTDSQIYTCGSGTIGAATAAANEQDDNNNVENNAGDGNDDVDNLLPATISIPISSSTAATTTTSTTQSSPLSQQQQERHHIVMNPVFNYASSSDDGDQDRINGFFGDTDTEDEEEMLRRRNVVAHQQQQQYGPILIPNTNINNSSGAAAAGQANSSGPFPSVSSQQHDDNAPASSHWRNATPAVAMAAAGLGTALVGTMMNMNTPRHAATYDIHSIVPQQSQPATLSSHTMENVPQDMQSMSPDGIDSVKHRMTTTTTSPQTSSSPSKNNRTGGFPQQDDGYDKGVMAGTDNEGHVDEEQRKERQWISSYNCLMCLGCLFVVTGIASLVYFLLRNNDSATDALVPPPLPIAPTTGTVAPAVPTTPISVPSETTTPTPTFTPTMMPTISIRDELFTQLQNVSIDNGIAMNSSDTPQYMAFQWLLSDPKLIKYSTKKRIVRYALATFFYSTGGNTTTTTITNTSPTLSNATTTSSNTTTINLVIAQPTLWLDNYLWLSYNDECEWYTRARTGLCGYANATTTNSSRNNNTNERSTRVVLNLDVSYNNLQGTIPPEIGLLTTLQTLSVGGGPDTTLVGSIPVELGQLSLLKELRLPNNQLTGRIPASIGECQLVQSMDMSNNQLRGLIPSAVGKMTNLMILSLDYNRFQGPIPTTIGQCTGIKTLNLAHNTLALLPTELYELSNLIFLDVQNNSLAGSLESSSAMDGLSKINTILLSHNQFTGTLPSEFNRLSNLKVLDLSYNSFTGTIPYSFVNDNVATATPVNDSNAFTNNTNGGSNNTITTAISSSTNATVVTNTLRVLQLNNNQFSGMVPESFRAFSNLQVLNLHSNALLNGSIPSIVCEVFNTSRTTVSVDCINVDCPCCIFCCNENTMTTDIHNDTIASMTDTSSSTTIDDNFNDVCVCRHWNTTMEWLCY